MLPTAYPPIPAVEDEQVPDMSAISLTRSSDGVFTEVNDAWVRLFGYGREEVLGRTAVQVGIVPEQPGDDPFFRGGSSSGQMRQWEAEVITRSGEHRSVAGLASPIEMAGERYVLIRAQDVTRRNQAARAAHDDYRRLYVVLSSMYASILLMTNERRVEFVNPAFCEIFGVTGPPQDLIGLTPNELLARIENAYARPDEAAARVREISRASVPVRGEEVTLRDGRTLLCDFLPLTVDGSPAGRLWLAVDITARKRAEEKLREASRRKDEFLSMLSHELRNPLAPIRNSLYILDRAEPGGEQARRARAIVERQVVHLVRLVDDLLDVTRIVRGKIELRRERVDLVATVARAAEDQRPVLAQAKVSLSMELPDRPIWADVDATRITQVVGNLLQNAAKFTPALGQVTVVLQRLDGIAALSVRDTGIGIGPELLGRVFEPFVQAERSLARTQGGLGLGLALAKGLVELHGGTISAASDGLGCGAEFTIRLPVPPSDESRPEPPRSAAGRRVLVVAQGQDAAQSLADLVAILGHEARFAVDGPSALHLAEELAPDVVLCDVALRAEDLAKGLRRDGTLLVAIGGYGQEEAVQAALAAGFTRHLPCPPDPAELQRILSGVE